MTKAEIQAFITLAGSNRIVQVICDNMRMFNFHAKDEYSFIAGTAGSEILYNISTNNTLNGQETVPFKLNATPLENIQSISTASSIPEILALLTDADYGNLSLADAQAVLNSFTVVKNRSSLPNGLHVS